MRYKPRLDEHTERLILAKVAFRERMAKKYSNASIAGSLGLHKRTVSKVLARNK